MKFLTLTFALLISLNTIVKADDVIGGIFENRKSKTQLQLRCLERGTDGQCLEMQYYIVKADIQKEVGPRLLADDVFRFETDDIVESAGFEESEKKSIPDFFKNGAFPLTKLYAEIDGYAIAAGVSLATCVVGLPIFAPAVFAGIVVVGFATPTVVDLVYLSSKGVVLGVTSTGVGSANLASSIKDNIKVMNLKKRFEKLGRVAGQNPDVKKISNRKFEKLVEVISNFNVIAESL